MRHTRARPVLLKTLSIKVPRAVSAKVVRVAKERRTTVSAIVRDAIERYFDGPQKGSFAEQAAKYIGAFDGPGDLSTNPKYMEGFATHGPQGEKDA